ncbi:MAG: redoxin domain-containing protein [Thermoproteota archaeon]
MEIEKKAAVELKLEFQALVPFLNLPSNRGSYINLWDFKQRKNLILIFHHGKNCLYCIAKLKELARIYSDIRALEGEVLAVSFDKIADLQRAGEENELPFPLLSDADGATTVRFTMIDNSKNTPFPTILITDRFGALRYWKTAEEATGLPSVDEMLSELLHIQSECPECSHL